MHKQNNNRTRIICRNWEGGREGEKSLLFETAIVENRTLFVLLLNKFRETKKKERRGKK